MHILMSLLIVLRDPLTLVSSPLVWQPLQPESALGSRAMPRTPLAGQAYNKSLLGREHKTGRMQLDSQAE